MKNKFLIIGICTIFIVIIIVFIIENRNNRLNSKIDNKLVNNNFYKDKEEFDENGITIYDANGNIRGIAYNEADLEMFENDPDFYIDLETPAIAQMEKLIEN